MQSYFVNSGMLIGLSLLAIPVLIHLINLMRRRRVQWAAMEFLLQSQKKNNTWIKLKELLLLLLRMAAVAAVVLALAQPLLHNQWARLFGGMRTHHIVLLDDSLSMSDRWGNTTAFLQAKQVVGRLGAEAARQPTAQEFTLLRFSRARASEGSSQFDLSRDKVDSRFAERIDELLKPLDASQLAVDLAPALAAIQPLLSDTSGEERVVYVVSDFRARDWDDSTAVVEGLSRLAEADTKLHFVNCVDAARPNVAITALAPLGGTRAAGVPVTMQVTVHNFGSAPIANVAVLLKEDGRERPTVVIDEISAGRAETRRFEVFFPTAGIHDVTAELAGDAINVDNKRYCLIDLPLVDSVLIVDGDSDARNAKFLSSVFKPGGSARTGLEPQIERPDFLNRQPLSKFRAIYLTDIERLDAPAITALEEYARGGGGVVFFAGPRTQAKFINDKLYRDGVGLFPTPLLRETQLLVSRLEAGPDLEIADEGALHAIFSGERNSYLDGVSIERYFSVPKGWSPHAGSATRVLARLRNGEPLVIENEFGKGHVIAVLTTAAPQWNNWGRNPSFVVALLEMQSHLALTSSRDAARDVGTPIALELDAASYQPRVRLLSAELGEGGSISTDAPLVDSQLAVRLPPVENSGYYELQLTTIDNQSESQRFAFNVVADEGDLALIGRDDLRSRLKDIPYDFREAAEFQGTVEEQAGANLSDWMLYALIGLLLGEQALAYSASYHSPRKEAP